MAVCPNCLNQKSDDHLFCPWCGYRPDPLQADSGAGKTAAESGPIGQTQPSIGATVVEDDDQPGLNKTTVETGSGTIDRRTMVYDAAGQTGELPGTKAQQLPRETLFFAWVVFVDEEGVPFQHVRLEKMKNILGSGSDAEIMVADDFVSRLHALVYYEKAEKEFYLSDLGSTNGTFLNERKIMKEKLYDGDLFRIGNRNMIFKRVNRDLTLSPTAAGENK